jgi:hypothetical protein
VSSGEWVRVRVLERRRFSVSGIGLLGQQVFTTLGCTMSYLFSTSYIMLYMLSKRDTFMCPECLSSSPSITQKMRVIFLVRLLLSNVRVDKYPLMTNDATLRARLAGIANIYQPPSTSMAEGFDPVSRNLRSLRRSVPREWILRARQALLLAGWDQSPVADPLPKSGGRLQNVVPGSSVDSSGSLSSPVPQAHGAFALQRVCTVACRAVDSGVQNHRPRLPRGVGASLGTESV